MKGGEIMAELTAPVVLKNTAKRIVLGPVLVPDEPDTDNDVVSKEKIEEVAHLFMERYGNIDLQHTLNNVGKVIESYILPFDWQINDEYIIPAGSWMMGVKVVDEESWAAVEAGLLNGFSIMAVSKTVLKSKESQTEKSKAVKRTTLADLEANGDWIVNAVSLVDEPAVPKARFIAVKSKNEHQSIVEKALAGSLEHRRALIRDKLYAVFEHENNSVYLHSTMPDYVIMEVYDYQENTEKKFKVNYSISETGEVTFTSMPVEVEIQEVLVSKTSSQKAQDGSQSIPDSEGNKNHSEGSRTPQKANKSLFDKLKEKLGFKSAENEEGESSMKLEDVQKMIDESLNPLRDQMSEVISTLKSMGEQKKEDEAQKQAGTADEAGKEPESSTKSNEEASYKAKYEALVKELENFKKNIPFSYRLTGQDGMTSEKTKQEEEEYDRDPFGFKRKA